MYLIPGNFYTSSAFECSQGYHKVDTAQIEGQKTDSRRSFTLYRARVKLDPLDHKGLSYNIYENE